MLSKSRYCAFAQCPKKLWLHTYKPQLAAKDPALDARLAEGNAVGDLAMGLFGDFTEVTALKADGKLDLAEMIARTSTLIQKGEHVICEASFSYNGSYCAVDILKRERGGYAIYEVKSATAPSDIYAVDIAYQKYVLEQCGIRVTGTYLVHINSGYVFDGTLKLNEFFTTVDLSAEVAVHMPHIEEEIRKATAVLALPSEPTCDLSESCKDPYDCAFWEHCTAHLPKPSVFDLCHFGKKFEYYRKGIVSFDSLARDKDATKSRLRSLQIDHQLNDLPTHVDRGGIRKFLATLSFPLYFLDFETIRPVIPAFVGTSPYAQIPTQYSLHYLETPDGELKHKEFLAESGKDPRRDIAEQLCADIPGNVCILAYNKSFECDRLRELAKCCPDLATQLEAMADHVKDLIVPFRSGYYYNRAMNGSSSIKKVLPAVFPNDPALDYHNLTGVQNGGDAMTLFPKIKDMPPAEQAVARQNLLKYCELDTFAMVKLWQELVRAAK